MVIQIAEERCRVNGRRAVWSEQSRMENQVTAQNAKIP
jgi:hypothetical protein